MSLKIKISKEDLELISTKIRTEKNTKLLKRYQCLWLLNDNYQRKEIAHSLCLHVDTITDWIKIYNRGGLSALGLLNYKGRRVSRLDAIIESIQEMIEKECISSIKELGQKIKEKHKIEVESSWLYRYCKKNSIAVIRRQN